MNWTPMAPQRIKDPPRGRVYRRETGEAVLIGDVNINCGVCDDCKDDGLFVAYSDDLVPILEAIK